MKEIDDKSVDIICADLPYQTTRNSWDTLIPFDQLWQQYERVIKDNGAIVLTACQPFTSMLVMSNPKIFRYDLVWEKNNSTGFLNAKKMPLRKHESILIFYKELPVYNPQFVVGKPYTTKRKKPATTNYNHFKPVDTVSDGKRYPTSILRFSSDRGLHPTQKPVSLYEYILSTYSRPGDLVLDNVAGSFTTAIAAMNTGRNYICIEKDERYFKVGEKRITEHKRSMKNVVVEER